MVGEAIRIICFTVIGLCMSLCGFMIGYGRKEIYANKQYLKGVEDGYKRRMMEENDKSFFEPNNIDTDFYVDHEGDKNG